MCLVVKLAIIVLMYNCSVRLYLPLFVGGWMPYLRFCGCLRIMVSSTYCVVSLVFFFFSFCVPYVTSFSRLSFLIAPSVFSNVYLYCKCTESATTITTLITLFNYCYGFYLINIIMPLISYYFNAHLFLK